MTAVTHDHLRLAGYALAHALGSIQAGGPLCTLAMVEDAGGRELYRYEAESITESIQIAHAHLQQRLGPAARGALVVDGHLQVDGTQGDALEVELLGPGAVTLGTVRQQYRPERSRVLGSLRMLGVLRIGGLSAIGPLVTSDSLPPDAADLVLRGAFEHPDGPRLLLRPE